MCDCKSYNDYNNATTGTPEVFLKAPDWSSKESICIDACIAEVIQKIWDAGIVTRGCCCGHNKSAPNAIIDGDSEDIRKTLDILKGNGRFWIVGQCLENDIWASYYSGNPWTNGIYK
jgi:predicted alpha/beta-fold hydrolase